MCRRSGTSLFPTIGPPLTTYRLIDTFAGFFGGLNCVSPHRAYFRILAEVGQVAWSPDSRFVAVGGQDDLITIFSSRESRVVARCQGHSAFVTSIAFDPMRGGGYRFGSVGEDGKLVLVSPPPLLISLLVSLMRYDSGTLPRHRSIDRDIINRLPAHLITDSRRAPPSPSPGRVGRTSPSMSIRPEAASTLLRQIAKWRFSSPSW